MNLEELGNIWNSSDDELQQSVKINKDLFKEMSILKIKSHLGEMKWTSFFEIAVNALFLSFLIGFITANLWDLKYLTPAGILLFITVFSLGFSAYKLFLFFSIDAEHSILQTQKIIERLKFYNLLDKNLLYVFIPLFSAPFMIVMAKVLFGISLYFLGKWLIVYTVGSFLVAVIVVFFLKLFPDKNMQKTITFLQDIEALEN